MSGSSKVIKHSGLSTSFYLYSLQLVLKDKQKVHCWEFIPKALFIFLPEVQFLYSVEHPCLLKCFIYQPGTGVTSCVFKKYNKLLTMKSICFSKWRIIWFQSQTLSASELVPHLWDFDVEKIDVLIFNVKYLEYSPLANVAHNVSPVPVLNCELLNGPEPYREWVLSFFMGVTF